MKTICRLTIPYVEGRQQGDVLHEALVATGVRPQDIYVQTREGESHYGNWCFTPVLYCNALLKVVGYFRDHFTWPGELVDMKRGVLEASDIEVLRIGDRVRVEFLSGLCFPVSERGTVIAHSPDKITIRKHRSKKMGWVFSPNEEVTITKE